MGCTAEGSGFESLKVQKISVYSIVSIPCLGPTQPPIQWVLGVLSSGVKRPEREADHSPLFSAEVKNCGDISTSSCLQVVVFN
jgi:hypothetical protein